MTAVVSQPSHLAPGQALLNVVPSAPLDPGSLVFSIEQPPRGFLQELGGTPWGTTHTWLRSSAVSATPQGVDMVLGPEHTWNLRANVTYVLRLRDAATSEPLVERVAWKAIRMPSQPPRPLAPLPTAAAAPPPVLVVEPPPIQPPPATPAPTLIVPTPQPTRSRVPRGLIAGLVLVLLLAGGAAWFFLLMPHGAAIATNPPPTAPSNTPAAPVGPLGVQSARAFLQSSPDAAAAYGEARKYAQDGSPDALQGALLLLTRAADQGSGPADTALGRMYDPATFSAKTSAMKAPDVDKAALWYQRAAKADDPEGWFRLGVLNLSGRAAGPDMGPEQGVRDLQRAADLGYRGAKEELDKLKAAR
jgi:hypothetical protein